MHDIERFWNIAKYVSLIMTSHIVGAEFQQREPNPIKEIRIWQEKNEPDSYTDAGTGINELRGEKMSPIYRKCPLYIQRLSIPKCLHKLSICC